MEPLIDPERVEINHVLAACTFTAKDVLEIGSGNGRFIWKYANLARQVTGIDPKPPDLEKTSNPQVISHPNVSFAQGLGQALPFPAQAFDIVIFSWSL